MDEQEGYTAPDTVYRLRFEEEDMAGLVLRIRSGPLGAVLALDNFAALVASGQMKVTAPFEMFAAALIEWNLRDRDGAPVPPTYEGLMSQQEAFVMRLIRAWQNAMAGVAAPLETRSTSGAAAATLADLPTSAPQESRAS